MDIDAIPITQYEKHPNFGPSLQQIPPSLNEQKLCFHRGWNEEITSYLLTSSTFLEEKNVLELYADIFEFVCELCAVATTWYSAVPLWPFRDWNTSEKYLNSQQCKYLSCSLSFPEIFSLSLLMAHVRSV